jgi:Tol biopolymer transport system component
LFTGGSPRVSAGGNYLAYTVQEKTGKLSVWYLPLDKGRLPSPSQPTLFTRTSANEGFLAISPDEHYSAYQSDESGRNEISIKQFPSGESKLQVSVNGGNSPTWSKRGNELFYREGNRRLMVVPVSTQPMLKLGTPRSLFALQNGETPGAQGGGFRAGYDVSPDGKLFLMVQRVGDQTPRRTMVVVQNWFAEFKGKEKK